MLVGIDFGTCFSSVAVMKNGEPDATLIKDSQHGLGIPSVFLCYQGYEKCYGDKCYNGNRAMYSEDFIRYMKREVRKDRSNLDRDYTSGGKQFKLKEIISGYIRYLLDRCKDAAASDPEMKNDTKIDAVTITVPAGSGCIDKECSNNAMMSAEYRSLLKKTIIENTGLPENRVHVIDEPTAAALSYVYKSTSSDLSDKTVMTIDLGGGTLDYSIVRHNQALTAFNVLSRGGDLNLGGNDWDAALSEYICSNCEIPESVSDTDAFRESITKFKIDICKARALELDSDKDNGKNKKEKEHLFRYRIEGRNKLFRMTFSDFEKCTEPLLSRLITKIRSFLIDKDLINTLNNLVLVGGGCNMPHIKPRLIKEFPELFNSGNVSLYLPSKAISMGAAVNSFIRYESDEPILDKKLLEIKDCVAQTYGIKVHNSDTDDEYVYNILYKGQKFRLDGTATETTKNEIFAPKKNRHRVLINVFESDAPRSKESVLINPENANETSRQILIKTPKEYIEKNEPFGVKVKFTVNRDGDLIITIKDAKTGQILITSEE